MTNKLHNRTLFVAALSVYFGLIIVGAPPQVLAQNQSLGNKTAVQSLVGQNLYADVLKNLVVDLDRLAKEGKYSWNEEINSEYEGFSICESDNSPSFGDSYVKKNNRKVQLLLNSTAESIVRNLSKIESAFLDEPQRRGTFDIFVTFDKSNLVVNVKPTNFNWEETELDFAGAFSSYFE